MTTVRFRLWPRDLSACLMGLLNIYEGSDCFELATASGNRSIVFRTMPDARSAYRSLACGSVQASG